MYDTLSFCAYEHKRLGLGIGFFSDFCNVYGSVQSAAGMASSQLAIRATTALSRKKQINIRTPALETLFKNILKINTSALFYFLQCAFHGCKVPQPQARFFIRLDQLRRRATLTILFLPRGKNQRVIAVRRSTSFYCRIVEFIILWCVK